MNRIVYGSKFKKQAGKLGPKDKELVRETIKDLTQINLEAIRSYKLSHPLNHVSALKKKKLWDCHIRGDLILVFSFDKEKKIVRLFLVGSHSDLRL